MGFRRIWVSVEVSLVWLNLGRQRSSFSGKCEIEIHFWHSWMINYFFSDNIFLYVGGGAGVNNLVVDLRFALYFTVKIFY